MKQTTMKKVAICKKYIFLISLSMTRSSRQICPHTHTLSCFATFGTQSNCHTALFLTNRSPSCTSVINHNKEKTHGKCVNDSIPLANSSRNIYLLLLHYVWYPIGV